MIETLKKNVKNKTWWIAVISLLVIIAQHNGLDLTKYIGSDWQVTLNNVFTLLALIGISVDTTNTGGVTNEVVQETTQSENNTTIEPEILEESFHGAKKEQLQSLVQQINTIINE